MLTITGINDNYNHFSFGQSALIVAQRNTGKTKYTFDKILNDLNGEEGNYDCTYILTNEHNYNKNWSNYGKKVLEEELEIIKERVDNYNDNVVLVLDDAYFTNFSPNSLEIISNFINKRPKNLMLVCIVQYYLQIPLQIRNGFTYLILGKQNDKMLGLDDNNENRVIELKNKLRHFEFVMINKSIDNLKINEL
jgi:hypothetical protein